MNHDRLRQDPCDLSICQIITISTSELLQFLLYRLQSEDFRKVGKEEDSSPSRWPAPSTIGQENIRRYERRGTGGWTRRGGSLNVKAESFTRQRDTERERERERGGKLWGWRSQAHDLIYRGFILSGPLSAP